jgi:ATP-dependent exoDNAse (exonuclease V) alpha subunit
VSTELTLDQSAALTAIQQWFRRDSDTTPDKLYRSFLLDGAAGTGKTFCLQLLLDSLDDAGSVLFTAPTNKAVKVLQKTLTAADIHSECRTIYSALNLRMMPDGGVKTLTASEDRGRVNWDTTSLCVVDEASMVGKVLRGYIDDLQSAHGVRFLYVGDSAQLPPVGEPTSAVIDGHPGETTATLTKVVRQDNQILTLGAAIRKQVYSWAPCITLAPDNDGQEGVWRYILASEAEHSILQAIDAGLFQSSTGAKAIAWRNSVVNKLNMFIRSHLYPEAREFFCEGDRIILTEPCTELSMARGQQRKTMHTTDTEGVVNSMQLEQHPHHRQFECYHLSATSDEGRQMDLWVLGQDKKTQSTWKAEKERLLQEARANSRLWPAFWSFLESFHAVRHGYAITAHRAQGSTYEQAFVNSSDIFCNQNRSEAFRCLYVACTRPRKRLFLW